jgi:cellobiose-specific phosphotransferase system component IIA
MCNGTSLEELNKISVKLTNQADKLSQELEALDKAEYKAYERDEEAELLVKMSEQAKVLAHEFQTLLFNINASMEKI